LTILELVELVRSGSIVLPEFQRDFVWKPDAVIELLNSISRGWPIGSILLIEAPQKLGMRQIKGGPHINTGEERYFLLDGQQRVTSIYNALTGTGDIRFWVRFDEIGDDGLPTIGWTKRKSWQVISQREMALAEYIDNRRFEAAVSGLRPDLQKVAVLSRSSQLGDLLDGRYTLPATVLNATTDPDSLTEIFETLNRTGTRLDAFDLAIASTYSPKFNLRNEWKRAQASHERLRRFKSSGMEILRLIALSRIHEEQREGRQKARTVGIRQADITQMPSEYIAANWTTALEDYLRALSYMEVTFGVADAESIPSRSMLVGLSYLLRHQIRDIDTWYWTSIARQTYKSGANTRVIQDTERPSRQLERAGWREELALGLQRPAAQNRVLRLGIRGLVNLQKLPPLLPPEGPGPLREVLLPVRYTDHPSSISAAIWCKKEDLAKTRRLVGLGELEESEPETLRVQLISDIPLEEEAINRRSQWIASMIEERIK